MTLGCKISYIVYVGIFEQTELDICNIVILRVKARDQWADWISSWTILLISSDEFSSHSTGPR